MAKKYSDPTASLRITAIDVPVAGEIYTIPALPATDWLEILLSEHMDLLALFPGLAGPEAYVAVDEALWAEELQPEELELIIGDVVAVASGRPWWFTFRLCAAVRAAWDVVGGDMAMRGVDPTRMSLAAWTDVAYASLRNNLRKDTEQHRSESQSFLDQLNRPPGSNGFDEELDEEADSEAFLAAMNAS